MPKRKLLGYGVAVGAEIVNVDGVGHVLTKEQAVRLYGEMTAKWGEGYAIVEIKALAFTATL